jgi:glycosyltransferase 2 family protein
LFSPLRLRLGKIFNTLNIGYFLSNLFPARIGDLVRAYLIGDIEGVSKARALSTIIVERMSDGLAVVLLLAVTALYVPNIPLEARQGAIGTAIVGVVAVLVLLLLSFQKARGLLLLRRLTAPFSFLQHPGIWGALESLIDGFAVLRSPRPLLGVAVWALFAWTVGGIMYWVVMQAMNSPAMNLPITAAYLVMTVTSLVVVLPSSPGYIGVFHYFAVLTLTTVFGVDKNIALSYAVVMHAFTYIWLIMLGVFSLWHEGMTYQRLQSIETQAIKN